MTNNEKLYFEISQLRQDKIIYAIESAATNLAVLIFIIGLYFFSNYFNLPISVFMFFFFGSIVLALGYTFYMGVSNSKRLQKIKQLEKDL